MTAVDVDALDNLRDELAELVWGVLVAAGLRDGTRAPSPSVIAHAVVGNLLPVVDRIANERAAAELRAAAKAIRWDGLLQASDYAGYAAQLVDVRADALDPT